MPTRFTHKNFYIDVHIIRRAWSDSELFKPKVDVGPEDGNHVVADGISLTRIGVWIDTALIWCELSFTARAWPNQLRNQQRHDGKCYRQSNEQEDRYVVG